MSSSVNKVVLIGNVGKDPEIKSLQNGSRVANLRIATSESWRDKNSGEKREKTEWHQVVVWNDGLVKVIEGYVKKGSKLYIEGQLQTRKWQDQSGAERYSTEVVLQGFGAKVVLLDGNKSGNGSAPNGNDDHDDRHAGRDHDYERQQAKAKPAGPGYDKMMDDEIPF